MGYVIAAFIVGVLVGIIVAALNEDLAETLFGAFAFILRPALPFVFWARAARSMSGLSMYGTDGEELTWVTDGNEWIGIFSREDKRGGFSPLFLLPAGVVRLLVRLIGKDTAVAYGRSPEEGTIARALKVAPYLTLARRRPQDLAYLEENGVFPTIDLTQEELARA